ncbi:MAG: glycosyltransferase family 4 protein [Pyrinomonadaceae bacterium]
MKVLGLCSYPIESAATRYRLTQFTSPLAAQGIDLTVSPFLDSRQFSLLYRNKSLTGKIVELWKPLMRRFAEVLKGRKFDLILIQREAMFFGPAFFEGLFRLVGKYPLILDLDDATYIRYVSPTYGKIGSFFKFFGKTDALIKKSAVVTCGNRFIADYVEKKGTKAVVIPTVVDTDRFRPAEERIESAPVIGWIGTHSTFPFLKSIFPVLEKLAEKHDFVLKIVGAGVDKVELNGVKVQNLPWKLDRELSDFQSFDIGLYPMTTISSANEEWLAGKSGFKAIQYMAVGIPFVMTPVGVCAEIGRPGETHFNALTDEDWYNALVKLLSAESLRQRMGEQSRACSLEHYTVGAQAEILARTLHCVGGKI